MTINCNFQDLYFF